MPVLQSLHEVPSSIPGSTGPGPTMTGNSTRTQTLARGYTARAEHLGPKKTGTQRVELKSLPGLGKMAVSKAANWMCVGGKERLHIAVYRRGPDPASLKDYGNWETGNWNWAFLIAPKNESSSRAVRCRLVHETPAKDAKDTKGAARLWRSSTQNWTTLKTSKFLGRVTVGKVVDGYRLRQIIKSVPFNPHGGTGTDKDWTRAVVARLDADGKTLGTGDTNWSNIERNLRMLTDHPPTSNARGVPTADTMSYLYRDRWY